MVKRKFDGETRVLLVRPDRSMSWQQNRWLVAVLGGFTLVVALFWTMVGAWVILPFAGIEVLALYLGLHYVSWKLHLCQVVRIDADKVTVEEGHNFPRRSWQLERPGTAIAIVTPAHPWDAPGILLYDRKHQVELGSFLSKGDAGLLVEELCEAGLRVRSKSLPRRKDF
jgi:uncharacterized membrane protein